MGYAVSKLKPFPKPINKEMFAGSWYVNAVIPTSPEKGAVDPVETYTFKEGKKNTADVLFEFKKKGKDTTMTQYLYSNDKDGNWKVSPIVQVSAIKLSYTILDIGGEEVESKEDGTEVKRYNHIVVAHGRTYAWIMSRSPTLDQQKIDSGIKTLKDNGFTQETIDKSLVYPEHTTK